MPRPHRSPAPACWLSLVAAAFAACHDSDGALARTPAVGVLQNVGPVALDEPLRITFDRPIDPGSLVAPTLQIVAVDGIGFGVAARGQWRPAGADAVEFVPALPRPEPGPHDGGLQRATTYELRVAGGDTLGALRFLDGTRLAEPLRVQVTTRPGSDPRTLFASHRPGGPRVVSVSPAPVDSEGRWRLGRAGEFPELRVTFDQPLDPRPANLPFAASAAVPMPFALHYDDPVYGADTAVPFAAELEANTVTGSIVVLRPQGVLPSSATLRLVVAPTLRDLFGEDRRGLGEAPLAATIGTEDTYAPLFDAVVVDFQRAQDLGAADFGEVQAVVAGGALRVPEDFPEVEGIGDWTPQGDVVLRTDVQELRYVAGSPRTFEGGVLHVRNLHIPAGTVVRSVGPNPLVLVVHGDARIDGVLRANGRSARIPLAVQYRGPGDLLVGNIASQQHSLVAGGPGGGSGAQQSRWARLGDRSHGQGPAGSPASGGQGGQPACDTCVRSSGGGGGAMATAGDPWFPTPSGSGNVFVQRQGAGGYGCAGASGSAIRTLPGGDAGTSVFTNEDTGDDFWGRAYEPRTGLRRSGELSSPVGGGGGGAGGNYSGTCDPGMQIFGTGGPGGGGGGVVALQVRGTLTIGETGRVEANGGLGEVANYYVSTFGGGGGGAGGMVALMAGRSIVLHAHGETFANRDYDFVVSADGGVCASRGSFAIVQGKYPANGQPTFTGAYYDADPLGGFGGLGIVQLMVPIGTDNADGTNTVLDDAITVVRDGLTLQGIDKQRYLGWRGTPDETGAWLDDFGMPTNTAGGQGDIRPAPVLMPAPFAAEGRARARSRWLPLGARHRRSLSAEDGAPRGVVGFGLAFGSAARSDGWLPFTDQGQLLERAGHAVFAAPVPVLEAEANTTHHGKPAHRLRLASSALGEERDRYAGYAAQLHDAATTMLAVRVLAGDRDTLWLEADLPLPNGIAAVQLHAFFAEFAGHAPQAYSDHRNQLLPRGNARLGFAFHRAPERALAAGLDPDRFPSDTREFLRDLGEPWLQPRLRAFGPTHLQWDALLDGRFRLDARDAPPPADGGSAVALRRAWLPVRF